MPKINQEELAQICQARDILCNFCEDDNCEKCQVTILVNDAYNELESDEDEEIENPKNSLYVERKHREGVCPICSNQNINYKDFTVHDDAVIYGWTCNECDSSGKEAHTITFSPTKEQPVQGVCPVCGNKKLTYGESELKDDMLIKTYMCEKCKSKGKETYDVKFSEHYDIE